MFHPFKPNWTPDGPLVCNQVQIVTTYILSCSTGQIRSGNSAIWQRRLYHIEQKSTQPQLYLEKMEKFNATYPNWPFALVRLGRAYLLLEDLQGALEQFETALRLLSPVQDDKFARYVEGLRAYIMKVTIRPLRNAWLTRDHFC
jgi:tetratricopeptide (TPR) repeat protein